MSPMLLPASLILFFACSIVSQRATTCDWLEWSDWSDCTDNCGSCGIHIRTRTCMTNDGNCRCEGSGTQIDYCGLDVCLHPRKACCFDTVVVVQDNKFVCVPGDGGSLVPLFNK